MCVFDHFMLQINRNIFTKAKAIHFSLQALAYATNIYKSQGSEYPVVVIPLLMTHFVMLQRNLVYTGITRAKKICIIVGTTKALAYSIHNMVVQKRNTKLKERLSL